jgi:protein required for attachment to host cells
MNEDRTLVAVFDSDHALFFEYKPAHGKLVAALEDVKSTLDHDKRDIDTDKPGRGFSGNGSHHSYESPSDVRKLEKHDFVRAVAQGIDEALERHEFGRLAVVAPSRSMGEFRSVASDKVKKMIWREVPKEFANMPIPELERHLVPILQQPAS